MSRAISQASWDGEATLELIDRDVPRPLPTEVLIRVVAAGINPIDVFTSTGLGFLETLSLPFVSGWDVAGVVEDVGYGVYRFAVGDEVFGMPWFPLAAGTYADHVTAPSRHVVCKPPSLSFEEAAALPLAGLTALRMIDDIAHVGEGDRVLVTGAAGGVGHLAVQIARARGAHVIAVARTARHDFIRSLGAHEVIDPTEVDLATAAPAMDVVIELTGPDLTFEALRTLRSDGLIVSAVAIMVPGLHDDARELGLRSSGFLVEPDAAGLDVLAAMVESGDLRVCVGASFPLDEFSAARHALVADRPNGKIILRVDP